MEDLLDLGKLIVDVGGLLLAAVSAIISIVSIIISVFQAIKVEKLKAKLEIEKNKAILNDSKIRQAYENFIYSMMNIDNKEKYWEIEEWIKNFTKNMLLFSEHNTIQAINKYKLNTNDDRIVRIWLAEDIFFAMRKDLWVSNDWIKHWDLIQFLVSWDISNILNGKK